MPAECGGVSGPARRGTRRVIWYGWLCRPPVRVSLHLLVGGDFKTAPMSHTPCLASSHPVLCPSSLLRHLQHLLLHQPLFPITPSSVASSYPFPLQARSLLPAAAATPPGSVPSCLTFSPVPWVLDSVLTHDSAAACVGGSKPVSLVQACLWDGVCVFCGCPGGSHSLPAQVASPPANPPRKSPPPLGRPLYHPVPPLAHSPSWSLPRDCPMPCSPGTTLEHLVGPATDEALGNADPSTSTLTAGGGGPWPGRGSELTEFARVRPRLTPHPDLDPCPLRVWLVVFSSGSERAHCCHMHCWIKDDHHILVRLLHRNCISKVPAPLSTHLCV